MRSYVDRNCRTASVEQTELNVVVRFLPRPTRHHKEITTFHYVFTALVSPLTAGAAYIRVFIFISTLSTTFSIVKDKM